MDHVMKTNNSQNDGSGASASAASQADGLSDQAKKLGRNQIAFYAPVTRNGGGPSSSGL